LKTKFRIKEVKRNGQSEFYPQIKIPENKKINFNYEVDGKWLTIKNFNLPKESPKFRPSNYNSIEECKELIDEFKINLNVYIVKEKIIIHEI
jgi:hypothetical protein